MAALIWTERAVDSLEGIYDYIATDSPFYARFQVEKIATTVERLTTFPESGRKLPELPNLPYREVIVDNYRAIYRIDNEADKIIMSDYQMVEAGGIEQPDYARKPA